MFGLPDSCFFVDQWLKEDYPRALLKERAGQFKKA